MKSLSYFFHVAIALGLTVVPTMFAAAQDLPPERALKDWRDQVMYGGGPSLCIIDIDVTTGADSPKLLEGKSKAVLFQSKKLDYEWCSAEGTVLAAEPGFELYDRPDGKMSFVPFFRGGREILWVDGQAYSVAKKKPLSDIDVRQETFAFGVLPDPVEWPLSNRTYFDLSNRMNAVGDGSQILLIPETRLVEWNQSKGVVNGKWVRLIPDYDNAAFSVIHFDSEGRPIYYAHGVYVPSKNQYTTQGEAWTTWTECNGDPVPDKITFEWNMGRPDISLFHVEADFTWHAPGDNKYDEYEKKLTEFAEGLPKPSRTIAGAEEPKPKN